MSGAIAELWSDFYCQITTQNSRFSQFKKVFWWDYFSVFRSLGCCFEFGQSILSTIAQIWHENSAHNFFVKLQSATIGPCLLTSFFCYFSGPLGAISSLAAQSSATSEANSAATSRTGSRENLCEECIQNPLDLIDASIQVCLTFSSILKFKQWVQSLSETSVESEKKVLVFVKLI